MKRKQLTARAAFLMIARAFDRANKIDGWYRAKLFDHCVGGICRAIEVVFECGRTSFKTYDVMYQIIQKNEPYDHDGYWWPQHTKRGAQSRAKFCRKMADLCKESS